MFDEETLRTMIETAGLEAFEYIGADDDGTVCVGATGGTLREMLALLASTCATGKGAARLIEMARYQATEHGEILYWPHTTRRIVL